MEFGGFGRAFGTNVTGMRAPKRAEDWVMIRRLENRVHLQITSTPRRDADSFKLKELCCTVGHACKQHSVPPRSPSVPQSSLGGRNCGKNAGIMVLYLPTYRLPPPRPFLSPFRPAQRISASPRLHPASQPASSHLGSPSSPIERLADSRTQIAPWNGACGGFCSAPAPWLGVSAGPGPAPLKPEIITAI